MAEQPRQADEAGGPQPADTAPRPEVPLAWGDLGIWVILGAGAFGVYCCTLAPGLLRGTSAEFQTLAATPGYAHPPGAPVYVLLARTAALVPVGDVAYRVNLLSAVMGAVAVGLTYLAGRLLVGRRCVSIAGATALAVSPTFWSRAILAEVYTSAAALMLLVLLALIAWQRGGRSRWLFGAAGLTAVGLGVHAGALLIVPGALALLVLSPRRWVAGAAAASGGAIAGLAVLGAAFWAIDRADSRASYFRAVMVPSRSAWGLELDDLDDFPDRVRLSLSALPYRDNLFSKPLGVTRQRAVDYVKNLPREFPPLWVAAAAGGVVWLGRKSWRVTLLLVLTMLAHLLFDWHYETPHFHLLYIATYVLVALFGVAGLALGADLWATLSRRSGRPGRSPAALNAIVGILGVVVVLAPMVFPEAWTDAGRRRLWIPPEGEPWRLEDSGEFGRRVRLVVDNLEDDAVLFTAWDWLYPCYYVAHVEQGRTQMVFIEDYPLPYQRELADSAVEYVRLAAPTRPVYFTHVVVKVDELFELEPVRRGRQTLYRVGPPRWASDVKSP
jgi:hypothetical protein